jgi:hypothetical protein
MKKTAAATIFLFAIVVTNTFGAEILGTKLLGLGNYVGFFSDGYAPLKSGNARISASFYKYTYTDDLDAFRKLSGDEDEIDTTLEWALASYYSPAIVQIRPAEAAAMLPTTNPKLTGQILGANLYKEIQVLRFLNDTASVGRYENMLQFVCDKNGVTRAEIEAFYRANVRALITGAVDEEFNKISFSLDVPEKGSYNTTLTRNPQTGQYTLSYERPSVASDDKTLSATLLEALSSAMRNSGDFVPASIDTVRAQAALIPAVVYTEWKRKGVAGGVDALALITETLTNFYLNPNKNTYDALVGIYARYRMLGDGIAINPDQFASAAIIRYEIAIRAINKELQRKVTKDGEANPRTYAQIPNDQRYDIFSVRASQVR